MKQAVVCGFDIVVPNNVADWDAVAGDSDWERARIHSILSTLEPGDVFYDVGAEHGWMSVIYGQHVGGDNVVLIEPSPEFWPNIRFGWELNGLHRPLGTVQAFVGAATTERVDVSPWPDCAQGPECDAMAYRHLNHHATLIPTVALDDLVEWIGPAPKGVSIDVEGAELGVLEGMTQILKRDKPTVWMSVHPDLMLKDFGTTPRDLELHLGKECGYTHEVLAIDHEEHWKCWPREW